MRTTLIRRGSAATVAAGALLVLGSGAAWADNPYPGTSIVITDPVAQTLEYGAPWTVNASGTWQYILNGPAANTAFTPSASITGAESGYVPLSYGYTASDDFDIRVVVQSATDRKPLEPGDYEITVTVVPTYGPDTYSTSTPTPAKITVVPASLITSVTAVADPGNKDAAIISAAFTGDFASAWYPSTSPSAAPAPQGSWRFTATAEDGTVALDETVPIDPDSASLTETYYWAGADPETDYAVRAEYIPDAESAGRFAPTTPAEFAYTSFPSQRPLPTPTVTSAPLLPVPASSAVPVPGWALVLGLVAAIVLAAGAAVLAVRSRLHRDATPALDAPTESGAL